MRYVGSANSPHTLCRLSWSTTSPCIDVSYNGCGVRRLRALNRHYRDARTQTSSTARRTCSMQSLVPILLIKLQTLRRDPAKRGERGDHAVVSCDSPGGRPSGLQREGVKYHLMRQCLKCSIAIGNKLQGKRKGHGTRSSDWQIGRPRPFESGFALLIDTYTFYL